VISTALAAVDAGVQVQVVEEACAGSTGENHRKALDIMRLYAPMIEIVSVEQLR
jgi:nicotinamidase-related amidase